MLELQQSQYISLQSLAVRGPSTGYCCLQTESSVLMKICSGTSVYSKQTQHREGANNNNKFLLPEAVFFVYKLVMFTL